ncbi:aminotransferase class IV [Gulosibacter molinativorax]|uniref:Aminotransferase class IV n=1 Tax=Gulosibacter molinativorax TaxID=256821 RepID=A0ABT7CA83_9MICO|nr:aminotransferase class IV [Gulosibacter molinativorax]MDJ1372064.1 hypothetical protein [Gulosibacter molinativorax]QUY63887.1 Hypotetical protein [Gulosibacter molinativorax]
MTVEYRWQGDAFVRVARDAPGELLVADSWRSEGGRVAAFEYHVARFEDACRRVSHVDYGWRAVWASLIRVIEAEGDASLFPRISLEAVGAVAGRDSGPSPDLILAIRPCPTARDETTLLVYDAPDPRLDPRTKGPDIPRLARAKAAALAADDATDARAADDIILTDADGALLEASTGSLVHWRDGGIVLSNRFERQLPSVTMRQVTDRAEQLGIPVDYRSIYATELGDGPLWFVNADHGVSPVSEVRAGRQAIAIPAHPDAHEWRDWWWATFEQPDANTATGRPALNFP